MCDLSPLTKLDLRARDPLDAWGKVFPGAEAPAGNRLCSASLCGQPLLAARLNPETIFLTASPGWGQAMEAAIREAGSAAKVSVTDVTSGFSIIELTGSAVPSILRKLTPVEPPAEDRTVTQARLAGVRSTIFRVDASSGEGGSSVPTYRLHVSRDVGLHLWEALEDAGREFKLSPYGMEARSRLFPDVVSG
jgi:sarcosine oxidase subunit alpha